jgi:hypothetical protein
VRFGNDKEIEDGERVHLVAFDVGEVFVDVNDRDALFYVMGEIGSAAEAGVVAPVDTEF